MDAPHAPRIVNYACAYVIGPLIGTLLVCVSIRSLLVTGSAENPWNQKKMRPCGCGDNGKWGAGVCSKVRRQHQYGMSRIDMGDDEQRFLADLEAVGIQDKEVRDEK